MRIGRSQSFCPLFPARSGTDWSAVDERCRARFPSLWVACWQSSTAVHLCSWAARYKAGIGSGSCLKVGGLG